MSKIATFSDLILFTYNELNEEEHSFLEKEMLFNPEMKNDYNGIITVKNALDQCSNKQPSDDVINRIMGYSQALNSFKLDTFSDNAFVLVN